MHGKNKTICIAGKNKCAIDCLTYLLKKYPDFEILAKISKSGYFFNKYVKQSIAHLFLPAIQIVLFFPCIFIFWR